MIIENIDIHWLGHDGFKIKADNKIIYIDPFKIKQQNEKADFLFITHEHFDHCSIEDIEKVLKEDTKIIAPAECQSVILRLKIKNHIQIVEPNKRYKVKDLEFYTTPAYNINKFRSPGAVYHPKIDEKVGYVINLAGKNILHTGDSDAIQELLELKNIDIALVPVSGTYVMTPEEAANLVNIIKPKYVIPMHYGEIVGTIENAKKFKELCKSNVIILEKGV